jgi:hypothetical protein
LIRTARPGTALRTVLEAQSAKPLAEHDGDRKTDQVANGNLKGAGSNNAVYLTARIARDHPAILERMKAGEFKSVRRRRSRRGS